jgi:hypothetical protein
MPNDMSFNIASSQLGPMNQHTIHTLELILFYNYFHKPL